jgi:hypothetical protein
MRLNKDWHLANKMPKNPSLEQRITWHKKHQKHCSCAPIPKKLQEEIRRQNA